MTTKSRTARNVSLLTQQTLALILAGGRGSRLESLTDWRAKPAVPFGGKFRIIDFALSNCINSGIRRMCLLTQYKSHSLIRHSIRAWSTLRGELGEFLELIPAQQRMNDENWYTGTTDAVHQSIDIIASHRPEYVLVLAGDHVYKMDYGEMLAAHVAAGADLTIACHKVPIGEAGEYGVMGVDADNRVRTFEEKPAAPISLPGDSDTALVSRGLYVFSIEYLLEALSRDAADPDSTRDFGHDLIPHAVARSHNVIAYSPGNPDDPDSSLEPYWRDVGTVDAYYRANVELLEPHPALDLYGPAWRIWTYQDQLPPGKLVVDEQGSHGIAENAMISGGCIVSGCHVRRSLLFSNVRIGSHGELDEAVILPDCRIGPRVRLRRVVVDKACSIPEDTVIGEDPVEDAKRFYRSPEGIVLVTRGMLGQDGPYLSYGASAGSAPR